MRVWQCESVWMWMCMHTYATVYMCVSIYRCVQTCATVNLCVHMHVGQCAMRACVCMCAHVHVCHSIHERACVHTCICATGCMLEVRKQFADFCSSLLPSLPPSLLSTTQILELGWSELAASAFLTC